MNTSLDFVLQHPGIWRGDQLAQEAGEILPTGYAELDEQLPGGGWARGALTEILLEREGIGELSLLLPALARASAHNAWQLWVAPPHIPYAPALSIAGLDLEHLLVAQPPTAADAWWTAEQALRSGACGAVLAWLKAPDEKRMRRLQLGAETGKAWGVLFRSARAAEERSTAALRLRLEATPEGLAVHILKRRGGQASRPVLLDLHRTARRARPAAAPALSVVPSLHAA
jgi:protein ImuA